MISRKVKCFLVYHYPRFLFGFDVLFGANLNNAVYIDTAYFGVCSAVSCSQFISQWQNATPKALASVVK